MKSKSWLVFYTAPRAEKKCEDLLLERDIEVLLPKRTVLRWWKDRKKKVIEPLFPNYIFAHADERDRLRVLQTDGIVRSVWLGGKLAALRLEEVEQLLITQRATERLDLGAYPLPAKGEIVRIVEGPLQGLKGEVIEHKNQTYIGISIDTIRQALHVSVPANWVRRTVELEL